MKLFTIIIKLSCVLFCFFLSLSEVSGQDSVLAAKPLIKIEDFEYVGAFRLPAKEYGDSDLNYSQGPLEYNPARNSIFIVGHSHQQALGEFAVPELVKSSEVSDLNMASSPLQEFVTVLGRVSGGNSQNINRIGGLEYVVGKNGAELLVNAYEYYDAPGDNTHSTFVIREADDLANAQVDGFFAFKGGAGHTSGWLSPIPTQYQELLGASHITGQSSGIPIISRTSVGPSAFVFNPLDIVGEITVPNPVNTSTLLDFSLKNPLHEDLSNSSLQNDLWTHLSRVVYGFIAPGTRSYITIGHSAGHESGVCYKCKQNTGNLCGGYCPPDADDYYHYYWLWDLNDLLAVKNGTMQPYDVRPYEYGKFPTPFQTRSLGGGTFDPATGLLYLTVQRADLLQGTYANPPVVVAYQFNIDKGSNTPVANGKKALIGKVKKKTIWCMGTTSKNMARIDKASKEGKLVKVKKAIRFIKKAVKKLSLKSNNRKKKNKLKSAKKNSRKCRKGTLTLE